MDNKTNNWIIGRELSRDYDNLHFLYKSLVKNVKKHRKWVHQDIKDDSQSTKDSILLINSSSDLTPNFGGTILFVNDQELLPKTEAKVIRLGTFFPDEFDYSNEIPLITLNPNNVLIDQLPNSNDSKNILLIRGKKENEKYKNILNALENLPKTTSIQLKSFVEDEIIEAIRKCHLSCLVLSSLEFPFCNQLFAEAVRMSGGKFHLFTDEIYSPIRHYGNHIPDNAFGEHTLSLRATISSLLDTLKKSDKKKLNLKSSLPAGIKIIEEIELLISMEHYHYVPISKESFDALLSHPIEYQFINQKVFSYASFTLHYLKHINNLDHVNKSMLNSPSIKHFFKKIGENLIKSECDSFQTYGIVDLVRTFPLFITCLNDYLAILSPISDFKIGIKIIVLLRSAYSNYNFSNETEKLFDVFFLYSIEWLKQANDSEATVCLGQILSLKDDQESLDHIFYSIIKTDRKFAQEFLSRSLLYGIYAKRGSEMPPRDTQMPQWIIDSCAMLEKVEEDDQISHDFNYLRAKGDIWKSEESRIKSILKDSEKRGGMYDLYLLELLEDSILSGLSHTSSLLAKKLLEKSKKFNVVNQLNLYTLLSLINANCPMPEIEPIEMTEKIPLCKRTFPDQTACTLSITAKLAKDENLSKFYRDLSFKMGFRKAKRLDKLLEIAEQVESPNICDSAVKIMNTIIPPLKA
jgi:hypothetical protein